MVDIDIINNPLAQALLPLVKSLTGGSASLTSIAATLSAQLGRVISPTDVVDTLRAIVQARASPFAATALNSAEIALEASAIAAEQAAAQATAAGLEQAAIQAARRKAVEAVLSQPLREVAKRGVMATVTEGLAAMGRAAARNAGGVFLGLSTAAWWLLGAGVAAIAIGGYIYTRGDAPIEPGARATGAQCPPVVRTARKCPWTPANYSVGECTPGFCWDGGPQGSLACKQENTPANAGRTYTTDVRCNDGFKEVRDRCTGVILHCER
jgi:hypothetical protein